MILIDPNLYRTLPEQRWVGRRIRITSMPETYAHDPEWIYTDDVGNQDNNMDQYRGCITRVTRLARPSTKHVVWVKVEIDGGAFTWDTRWLEALHAT